MKKTILEKYVEHFDDSVPTFAIPPDILHDDKKLEELINKCIKGNTPITDIYPYDKDIIY